MKRILAAVVIMLAFAACSEGTQTEAPRLAEAGPGGPFNWDAPQPEGMYLAETDLSSISSWLKFTPLQPRLKGLLHMDVTDPARMDPDGMLLFLFYQDPIYGRVVVKEQLSHIDQSAFEGMLAYNTEPTSQAIFALVNLDDGSEALIETVKIPSKDGLGVNSIEFIEGNADITVFGPDGTFTAVLALEVANLVLPIK